MNNRREQATKAFWRGFWQGLASSSFMPPPPSQKKAPSSPSELDSMRSDWRRIGADFDVAIKKARKATRAPA